MGKDEAGMATIFEEMEIGTFVARNRMVRAATAESLAEPSGKPTSELCALYERLAEGGVGTVITGYAYVTPDGKPSEGALGIYDDASADDYRALVGRVHAHGARIVAQLVYGGSKSKLPPDDPRRLTLAERDDEGQAPNVRILGASSVENPKTHLVPREATYEELAQLARAFGAAATRAKAYGFDGVEVHVAHGYLLSQFLSRRFNTRADGYGGTLANRARLALECIANVRQATGDEYPVFAKINCCDDLEDPSGTHGGLSESESVQVAHWLVEAGATCIDVSGDWHVASARMASGNPYFAEFGAHLARELDAAVIVTGGWRRADVVERHLAEDGIAGVGMSRPLICEPGLPNRWRSGDLTPSACTGCGYCQKHVGIPCAFRHEVGGIMTASYIHDKTGGVPCPNSMR